MITKDEAVKAYDQLVLFRQQNQLQKTTENPGTVETHHILPISCGGEDVIENRINLFAKEHFMAHVYLWIIHHEDEFHYQTMCALNMMVKGTLTGNKKELRDFILLSEEYQKAREEYAQFTSETIGSKISGEKNGAFGKHWYYDPVTLKNFTFFEGQQPNGWIKGRKPPKPKRQYTAHQLKQREQYAKMYAVYQVHGFEAVINEFQYPYTQANFVQQCKKHVQSFVPQIGKQRKI